MIDFPDFPASQLATSNEQTTLLLSQKKLPATPYRTQDVAPDRQLQTVVLRDGNSLLCVLLPRNHILDLRTLNSLLQANYLADYKQASSLMVRLQVHELPAIPDLLGLPCVYAAQLLDAEHLFVESGKPGYLFRLSRDAFAALVQEASPLLFSQEIPGSNPNLLPDDQDLQQIQKAVQSLTQLRIKQRLEETVEIPPLSATAKKILKLRTDPHAHVDELTAIVETDPAMAAQVMSWASSPYYASPGKIRSIEDAIVRALGFDLVINLALGLALGESLKLPAQNQRQNRNYWQHAVYTASLIEGLVLAMPRNSRPEPGLAYLAGLLHSFGYVLLAHLFPPYFNLINQYLEANPHLQACYVEHHLLGITREQMGAWLMQHWQMPKELTSAIRQQHNPDYQGEHAVYPLLTHLATQMLGSPDDVQRLPPSLFEKLHISHADAQQALNRVSAAEQALRTLAAQLSG